MREYEILDVHGIEILDSNGNPTLEVTVTLPEGVSGNAIVPSGKRFGQVDTVELRDGDRRHGGNGVEQAVNNVNSRIADKLIGMNVLEQVKIDSLLVQSDGTENRSKYGVNAMFGVSLACARAAANAMGVPLYRYIGGCNTKIIPMPMINLVDGTGEVSNPFDMQEFMIVPVGAHSFSHAMEMGCEIYHYFRNLLIEEGMAIGVGKQGGFIPSIPMVTDMLDLMIEAIKGAGYHPGEEIKIAIDAGATNLYDENSELYYFQGESRFGGKDVYRNGEELVQYYENLVERYPIFSIEDGMAQTDQKGWKLLTYRLSSKVLLVGDDLFVTNEKRLNEGIRGELANSVLVKSNQIGTLTETLDIIETAKRAGYGIVIGHRSDDTEDAYIADLAVAASVGLIKAGAPCRSERTVKYNRLLKIEEELGKVSDYSLGKMFMIGKK